MQIMKKIITLIFLLFFSKLFAYDYAWPVDYRFKINSQDEVNSIIEKFIYDNPEFQVYTVDWDSYLENSETKEDFFEICLKYKERIPFGNVLMGNVYLYDVETKVSFYILPVSLSPSGAVYLELSGYTKDLEKIGNKIITKKNPCWFSFNDVEPTQQEIPIKESFEKNFLSKLPLEYEYVDPGNLDRNISKFLTIFRKRKNFQDSIEDLDRNKNIKICLIIIIISFIISIKVIMKLVHVFFCTIHYSTSYKNLSPILKSNYEKLLQIQKAYSWDDIFIDVNTSSKKDTIYRTYFPARICFSFVTNQYHADNEFKINKVEIFDSKTRFHEIYSKILEPVELEFKKYGDMYLSEFATEEKYNFTGASSETYLIKLEMLNNITNEHKIFTMKFLPYVNCHFAFFRK